MATAVYYETDKLFPSNAISPRSSAQDAFETIAQKISEGPEVKAQVDGFKAEEEVSDIIDKT